MGTMHGGCIFTSIDTGCIAKAVVEGHSADVLGGLGKAVEEHALRASDFSSREVPIQQIGRCSFTSIAVDGCDTGDYLIGVVNHQTRVDIAKRHGLYIAGIPLEMNVPMSMCFRPNVISFRIEPYAIGTSVKTHRMKSDLY
jgi:hypothetical protein